ncbi:2-phospho-L-lactate guanylyltransferase [uncultured Thermanaerothrix sp.]|uniref:2-phospho-L-lactate guanylyltransferase n=1 Tax=uncultured Thermanaerothrix sp. TaxID=1195149 RepID=UPI00260D82B9|nr:2-phospho-L-lactate guanylyltransferase [uncultured Thermanaerothrix sp.]
MSTWAIVPVKPIYQGKSRLATVLSQHERVLLNQMLYMHLLQVLQEVRTIDEILVVSRDSSILAAARQYRARTLQEDGRTGLNLALRRATAMAEIYAASEVLILPVDLPLITAEDVQTILRVAPFERGIVIVPDRHRHGTNALLVRPPGALDYQFGSNSYEAHCRQARQKGLEVRTLDLPSVAFDLDWPEDLEHWRQLHSTPLVL